MGFELGFCNLSDFCYNIFIKSFTEDKELADRMPADSQMGLIYEMAKIKREKMFPFFSY